MGTDFNREKSNKTQTEDREKQGMKNEEEIRSAGQKQSGQKVHDKECSEEEKKQGYNQGSSCNQ